METFCNVLTYIKKVTWAIIAIVITAFMTHGSMLFSDRIGIDTDFIIAGEHNFDLIGRPGLIWLGKILGLDWFNLYYAQVLTFLFLIITPIAFAYLFCTVSKQTHCLNTTLLVLGLSFIVSPFWAAQIYFFNQSAQVTCSCVLITIAILLIEKSKKQKSLKWVYLISAILLLQLIFSCYQVLIMIYIMAVSTVFLFTCLQNNMTVKQQLQWIFHHIIIFLVAFTIYMTISKLFFLEAASYLEDQIKWNSMSFAECMENCMEAIGTSLTSKPPYYTGLYGVFALILLFITLYWLIAEKKFAKAEGIIFLLAELFLIISPYVFIFLYGGAIVDRMQLVMPLSQGCILYIIILLMYELKKETKLRRLMYKAVSIVLIIGLYKNTLTQMSYTNRLYYADEWRFQYDKTVAHDVYEDINDVLLANQLIDTDFDNILFLGCPYIPYNLMCVTGDVIGKSSFHFDVNNIHRHRITYLMEELGYPLDVRYSGGEQAAFYAYFDDYFGKQVAEMPVYPNDGYVQYLSNSDPELEYVVVKLGDNWRTWEY